MRKVLSRVGAAVVAVTLGLAAGQGAAMAGLVLTGAD